MIYAMQNFHQKNYFRVCFLVLLLNFYFITSLQSSSLEIEGRDITLRVMAPIARPVLESVFKNEELSIPLPSSFREVWANSFKLSQEDLLAIKAYNEECYKQMLTLRRFAEEDAKNNIMITDHMITDTYGIIINPAVKSRLTTNANK